MTLPRVAAVAVLIAITAACGNPVQPPDVTDGVPVVNESGEHVGTADQDEFDSAVEGGPPAPVFRDGRHVGHFGPEGYEPLE